MKIQEAISTIKAEFFTERTPKGRNLHEDALDALEVCIEDVDSYGEECTKCKNCGLIQSSMLCPKGCVYCGGHDLTTDIQPNEILGGNYE